MTDTEETKTITPPCIRVYLSFDEKRDILREAKEAGLTASAYLRQLGVQDARKRKRIRTAGGIQ